MYNGQGAIAVVDTRDSEELVALAHDGRGCDERAGISGHIRRQLVLITICWI
jgi:hypothetical protein